MRLQYGLAIAIGIVIIVAIFLFAFYLPKSNVPASTDGGNLELGAVGAECGGEMRLPCKPGNQCKISEASTGKGVCIKVTDDVAPVQP